MTPATEEAAQESVISRGTHVERLILHSLPASRVRPSLLRRLRSELRSLSLSPSRARTSNLPHLQALVHVLILPSVAAPSRLLLPHADLVCTFRSRPAWVLVSARNPVCLHWASSRRDAGVRPRVARALEAARASTAGPARPEVLVVFFFRGLASRDVEEGLRGEFRAVEVERQGLGFGEAEDGWVDVSWSEVRAFEILVGDGRSCEGCGGTAVVGGFEEGSGEEGLEGLGDGFREVVAGLIKEEGGVNLVNFDTTALVAMVSGISNGRGKEMVEAVEEMKEKFKGNYTFVMDQVHSELLSPIFVDLKPAIAGKKGLVCETVCKEFQQLISMYAGPNEKRRAAHILNCLLKVPDCPSTRISSLPTTRKIAMKNKIIFGTGDHWRAPTLTANMGFVRAIGQAGMSLLTIEHRPRALTGD